MLTTILLAALPLAIALGAYSCARLTRPDRNYWPMMRVMWAVVMAVYTGSFVNVLLNQQRSPAPVRLGFGLIFLGGVLYARWFMARRNRTPRFIGLDLAGRMTMLTMDEIEQAANVAESAARHGVMTTARVASLEAALAEWHRKQRWMEDTRRQLRERRARRAGRPGGGGENE